MSILSVVERKGYPPAETKSTKDYQKFEQVRGSGQDDIIFFKGGCRVLAVTEADL